MANFLHELGLEFIAEDEETFTKLIGIILHEGKVIRNYYDLPYVNQHFGSTQMICRLGKTPEGELQFVGFDSHTDSNCVWEMRIEEKMNNKDEDDPTRVKLLAHDMDGNNMLAIDVMNGDILPSFKKDEVIKLQMIAFTDHADFYADEAAYADTVEPGPNGKKTMIGEDTIFPIGMFSDNDDMKDVVQIHGTIKKMLIGITKFGENELKTNVRCIVDTQLGEIEIVLPLKDAEAARNIENMSVGKIINCFARLSGDAAIYEYENGIIKDAENNLKLVAYTLENGDPERLRTALSKDFEYKSESSGKQISNVDELITFVNYIQTEGKPAHTSYATVVSIDDGPDELEYPVGTRCAVIGYEGADALDAIIFVDTDEEGTIKRIYLSQNSRYHFKIDNPFPKKQSIEELLAETTYKSSIVGRAHYHSLIDNDTDEEEIDEYISGYRDELEADLSDLFDMESSEDVFAEAFLRGVKKSRIPENEYKEEEIIDLGKQFYKDATFFKTEDEQKEIYHDALILAAAIGRLYIGRTDYTP